MMKANRAERGFSLIELMMVVAILLVLISLILPVLRIARDSSATVGCAGNLRVVGSGLMMYSQDFANNARQVFPPCQFRDSNAGKESINGQHYASILVLNGYVLAPTSVAGQASPSRSVFMCPSGDDLPGDINGVLVATPMYPSGVIRSIPQPLYPGFNGYWENTNAADVNRVLVRTWYGVNGTNYRQSAMPRAGASAGNVGGDVDSNRLRWMQIKRQNSLVMLFDGYAAMFSDIAVPYSSRHNGNTITNCLLSEGAVVSVKVGDMPQAKFPQADISGTNFPKWNWSSVTQ